MTTRQALWAVIGVSSLVRLALAAALGPYAAEAYYFLYARHLDWGFFDHPPMVGVVAALGLKLAGGLSPVFGLRVGYIALFGGSTWLLARLTARSFGPPAGVLAALVLNATVFYGLLAGTLAGPDGPLLFFWLLTLDRLMVALNEPDRSSRWVVVGLAWGAAMLSKYHAVLLPAGALLYLLLRPSARRCLRTPGPYLAAVAGLAVFAPVVVWNATHGWASFAYQSGRASGFHGFKVATLIEALVAQVLYLTPWVFVGMVVVLARLLRRAPRNWSDAEAFYFSQALPALGLFLGVATFRQIMAHWPMIGFVALMPLVGRTLAERWAARPRRVSRVLGTLAAIPLVLGILVVVHARTGLLQDGRGRLLGMLPARADRTVDTIRWGQIARELRQRGLLDEPGTYLFTDYWQFSASLEMATEQAKPVACFIRDARSFTFWSEPEDWVGRDGIFVSVEDGLAEANYFAPWFTRIEPLASVPIMRAGFPMQTVRLYRCVHQNVPFPFGFLGPGRIPRPMAPTEPGRSDGGQTLGLHPTSEIVR
jgi:4-amino-4-deoxy-L-arabinose transferase-like glycosyltransferase